MTTAYDAPRDEIDDDRYWGPARIGLSVVVVLMVIMWGWIYLFSARTNPDRLQSRAFADAAEAVCSPIQAEIDALPTGRDVDTVAERADQIEQATELTETMVAGLRTVAAAHVTDPHDLEILDAWFDDWDFYIGDRWLHVEKLHTEGEDIADKDLRFILRSRGEGGIYTRRIDGLGNVNDMASCHVPGDI